jgi:predicted nucleic acid-binding protein
LRARRRRGESPRRAFVDSGAWVALASADDEQHSAADAVFREAVRARTVLTTSNLVISEVHRFLLFRAGIPAALAFLERTEESPLVRVQYAAAEHHASALDWLRRLGDQVITYTDAVSFAIAAATRSEAVIGFDHDFLIAGFRLWNTAKDAR